MSLPGLLNPVHEDDLLENINVSFDANVIARVHADKEEDGDENDDSGILFTVAVQLEGVPVTISLLEQQGVMSGDFKKFLLWSQRNLRLQKSTKIHQQLITEIFQRHLVILHTHNPNICISSVSPDSYVYSEVLLYKE